MIISENRKKGRLNLINKKKIGYIPAIVYNKKNINIFINKKEFLNCLKNNNRTVVINIDNKLINVYVKELQYCNFNNLIHVDFEIIKNKNNIIKVPVCVKNLKYSYFNNNKFYLDLIMKKITIICKEKIFGKLDINFKKYKKYKTIYIKDIIADYDFPRYLTEENPMILKFRDKN